MSANPALIRTPTGALLPAPFQGEYFVLQRPGVAFETDNVKTKSTRWKPTGTLYLSDVRLVFVANSADESGLAAFDLPLVYIRNDKLNQPIFGCNNLSGEVWPAVEGGGPAGTLPPHKFVVYFKEGGIGTFYPLYHVFSMRAKQAGQAARQQPQGSHTPEGVQETLQHAYVDPADPSKVYLTQPVDDSQRLPSAPPKYAANYGQDEKYEDMGLRP